MSVARSRSPRGPFEATPHNPVFTHRSTAHPAQNIGHADLVERPDGSWAAVYLGGVPLRGVADQGAGIRRSGAAAPPGRGFKSPQQGASWTTASAKTVRGVAPEHVTLDPLHHDAGHHLYLGTRPQGRSPRFHVNGRETFLADVSWVDDWPQFEPARCHAPTGQRDFEDDFSAPGLDPRWVSPGQRPDRFVHGAPEGVVVGHALSETGEPSGLFTRVGGDRWEAGFRRRPGRGCVHRCPTARWCPLVRPVRRRRRSHRRRTDRTGPVGSRLPPAARLPRHPPRPLHGARLERTGRHRTGHR